MGPVRNGQRSSGRNDDSQMFFSPDAHTSGRKVYLVHRSQYNVVCGVALVLLLDILP